MICKAKASRLLEALKLEGESVARRLRVAGWIEDSRGLWHRPGGGPPMGLFAADEVMRSEVR